MQHLYQSAVATRRRAFVRSLTCNHCCTVSVEEIYNIKTFSHLSKNNYNFFATMSSLQILNESNEVKYIAT